MNTITISDDDAQIFIFNQDNPPIDLQQLATSLSADEHDRMAMFATHRLRLRYLARRGMLRYLVGQWMGIDTSDVHFSYGEFGKLHLSDDYHINVSHSKQWVMVGLCRSSIGVDIEAMIASDDLADITRTHFASEEQLAWSALPENHRVQGFYNAWTRKEAFIKMDGHGLQIPLDSFVVTLAPDDNPRIIRSDCVDARAWQLWDLPVPSGFAGALVTGTQVRTVTLILWQS
ncbi:MAG: 4'-phosphopantetheinyl transferase superfamily protein [Chloroflexota bacterium]